MAYACKVGAAGLDAVDFVRQKIGDTDPTNYFVSDTAMQDYVQVVLQDISRFVSLEPQIVGNLYANTSPLITVPGQQRYLCNAASGFTYPVLRITDVLYRASSGYSAAQEIGYLALLPFSPVNAFLFTPNLVDSPTMRIERDAYLNEIEHYGRGMVGIGLDISGSYYIDLFPIPATASLPIFVKYETAHATTPIAGDPDNSVKVTTLPDAYARCFARLLHAEVLENEAYALADAASVQAGMIKVASSPDVIERQARRIKDDAYNELGLASGVAEVSN